VRRLWHWVVRFVEREDGPTAVEYAVMLAFIVIVCFLAVQLVGTTTSAHFANPAYKEAFSGT
jgi:pilus assembly protein Flp/PilA